MSWATFDYYENVYCGGVIKDPTAFLNTELKAKAYIDKITFGRIIDPVSNDVKNAVCAVCDVLYNQSEHAGVSSENIDGYSVSYSQADEMETAQEMYSVACLFLSSDLLYRGL